MAGYTRVADRAVTDPPRGQRADDEVPVLPGDPKSGKFPMYGVRTETEGLLFRLDPVRVVHWLVDVRCRRRPRRLDRHRRRRRWLFTVTDPVTDLFNAPDNRISEAVLGLTHSLRTG